MKKARILLALSIWVAILPYLGFPPSWKTVLFTLTGFGLIGLSYLLFLENKNKVKTESPKKFDSFLENKEYTEETNAF